MLRFHKCRSRGRLIELRTQELTFGTFGTVKRIHKDLTRYYADTLGHRLPPTPPNLTLVAKDGSRDETIKVWLYA